MATTRESTSGSMETFVNPNGTSKFTGGAPTAGLSSPQRSDFQAVADSAIVPPYGEGRTLVLCFDGTGDQFDSDNSNVVQLFTMLKKDDRSKQMVYYQAGIGTYQTPEIPTPVLSKMSRVLDEMFAWNIDAHLMDGYEFLMQNYTSGDRICIFGFSRGAYTARSLAGMLHKVGLLPACNHQQVPFAYKMFTRTDETGWKQSNAFKRAFSIDVNIEFIGVWDTVSSVGLIPRTLPFSTSNTIVKTFRHAVSLDEHRAKFKANLWNRPTAKEAKLGLTPDPPGAHKSAKPHQPKKHSNAHFERQYSQDQAVPTDVEEVWFAGCHCDVGGGSVDNDTRNTLARIPLRWMIRECFKAGTGITFDTQRLREVGLDPTTLYPAVLPRPPPLPVGAARLVSAKEVIKADTPMGTEEEEELKDAMMPVYDQLSLAWYWWVLELLPIKFRYQRADASWKSYIMMNLGRSRDIPHQAEKGVKVHRSVKMRMEAEGLGKNPYKPKPKFAVEPTWID